MTTVTDLISGKQHTLASRIPCENYQCTLEHATLRCGPGFANYHVGPPHSQATHGSDYGAYLTCAECAGEEA